MTKKKTQNTHKTRNTHAIHAHTPTPTRTHAHPHVRVFFGVYFSTPATGLLLENITLYVGKQGKFKGFLSQCTCINAQENQK